MQNYQGELSQRFSYGCHREIIYLVKGKAFKATSLFLRKGQVLERNAE